MENLPTTANTIPAPVQQETAFSSIKGFEAAMRMANALCASSMVPKAYQINPDQGNKAQAIGNAIVALELSQRIGASPFAVFQNMHVIQGRPSWSSSFIIAALNTCGRFAPIRFEMSGDGDDYGCTAWTYDKANKDRLDGPKVSIRMAKAEGWMGKAGSKWKTMPELMLRYRAAAFFGRLYAPDVLMGMHSEDEVRDMAEVTVLNDAPRPKPAARAHVAEDLNAAIMGDESDKPELKNEQPDTSAQGAEQQKRLTPTQMKALRNECARIAEENGRTGDIELLEKDFNAFIGQWSQKQCMKAMEFFSTPEHAEEAV